MDDRHRLGKAGEELVCRRLRERGWRLVERNARTRYGEIDLIVRGPSGMLAFVEVKTRRQGSARGPQTPAGAVDRRKAARIRRLAAAWLAENRSLGASAIRFDVAGVEVAANGGARITQYIEAAF